MCTYSLCGSKMAYYEWPMCTYSLSDWKMATDTRFQLTQNEKQRIHFDCFRFKAGRRRKWTDDDRWRGFHLNSQLRLAEWTTSQTKKQRFAKYCRVLRNSERLEDTKDRERVMKRVKEKDNEIEVMEIAFMEKETDINGKEDRTRQNKVIYKWTKK